MPGVTDRGSTAAVSMLCMQQERLHAHLMEDMLLAAAVTGSSVAFLAFRLSFFLAAFDFAAALTASTSAAHHRGGPSGGMPAAAAAQGRSVG